MKLVVALLFCLLTGFARSANYVSVNQVAEFAASQEVDPVLVAAIVAVESSNDPLALGGESSDKSYGLMQIKLGTARMMGFRGDTKKLMDWQHNLRYGIAYLKFQLNRYDGDWSAAIAAYNAGAAFICKTGRVRSTGKNCFKGQYTNQAYVDKVMAAYYELKIFRGDVFTNV